MAISNLGFPAAIDADETPPSSPVVAGGGDHTRPFCRTLLSTFNRLI